MNHHRAAFSLVETTLALGLFAFLFVALVGVLGHGIKTGRNAQHDYSIRLLSQNLQNRFALEANFPLPTTNTPVTFFCEADARESSNRSGAFQITLRALPNPNWPSPYLVSLSAEIRSAGGELLTQLPLARAQPSPAP